FVVSGGQGAQESITEAKAMKTLLLDGGVPESQIILEENATSTSENFIYSKQILDEYFGDKPYNAAFVTNDFHCYRAGRLANIHDLENIRCISAKTPKGAVLLCYAREVLAVIKLWLLKS
ncbi:MAG: YdcF family protein, partial [Firmicutes bacterium]|nr:YdcF family protein [Bacillota bacterium]